VLLRNPLVGGCCDTGAMESEESITRARQVRRRLVREGPSRTRYRAGNFEIVTLPERGCDLLRDLLIAEGAATMVEVVSYAIALSRLAWDSEGRGACRDWSSRRRG
jgi:hypothetical protein